jgi:hypothetical protein
VCCTADIGEPRGGSIVPELLADEEAPIDPEAAGKLRGGNSGLYVSSILQTWKDKSSLLFVFHFLEMQTKNLNFWPMRALISGGTAVSCLAIWAMSSIEERPGYRWRSKVSSCLPTAPAATLSKSTNSAAPVSSDAKTERQYLQNKNQRSLRHATATKQG